jgi:tetratricopeptide (TPR) repeat protein
MISHVSFGQVKTLWRGKVKASFRKTIVVVLCAALLATPLLPSFGCAPGFDEAIFSYSMHPDFPLIKFAQGELGIIEPAYARSYDVAAYRYMMDKPLSAEEQKAFNDMWKARLLDTAFADGYNNPAMQDWLKARGQVTKSPVEEIITSRKISNAADDYTEFENCPSNAFRNAVKTLNDRIAKYGATSSYVKEWVNGQDKVFCHCGAGRYDWNKKTVTPEGPFPEPVPANADAGLKADRAYQIAAAHFYSKMFDEAKKEFLAIAQDSSSPWQSMGLLLAARCMIRKGTLPTKPDKESLLQAAELLNQILKDPKLDSIHSTARGLLSFVDCQSDPDKKVTALAKALVDPSKDDALQQNIYDYTFLLDRYCPDAVPVDDPAVAAKQKPAPMPDVLKQDDLSEWLYTFQDQKTAESKARAIERWKSTHSLPWLVAVLNKAKPGDKDNEEIIAAARAVPPTSPAYLSVSYYLIDLLMAMNKKDEAGKELAKALEAKMPPSARNDFVDFQMELSPTVADFIKLSVRRPAGFFSDFTGMELPDDGDKLVNAKSYPVVSQLCYVPEAADILNTGMPLKLLKEAVFKSTAPVSQKFDLAQAVWIRAVLLKQEAIALNLIPVLKSLKPQYGSLFDAYANAKTPADRQFAAFNFILKNPGARPYVTPGAPREVDYGRIQDYGDNWWGNKGLLGDFRTDRGINSAKTCPPFMTAADQTAAKQEVKALQALGDAPNILTANVIAYAQTHPGDARVPEALSRCVKATKFGSKNAKTGSFSKQAFHLLHQKYGASAWAEKTPYYYGND